MCHYIGLSEYKLYMGRTLDLTRMDCQARDKVNLIFNRSRIRPMLIQDNMNYIMQFIKAGATPTQIIV